MTFTSVAAPSAYAGTPKRGPVTRLLEDERWLAMVLLLPTLVLLGLFIAYPFFKGVELSGNRHQGRRCRAILSGCRTSRRSGTTASFHVRGCGIPACTRLSPRVFKPCAGSLAGAPS